MLRPIVGAHVIEDARENPRGFLVVRKLKLRLKRDDGTESAECRYDFVERPMGRDAVVVALWHRGQSGKIEVLVRAGLRVPLWFVDGVDAANTAPPLLLELVAGIIERGEDGEDAWKARAAAEAEEEAGLVVDAKQIALLGAPVYATPGLCAEKFVFAACEVAERDAAHAPEGDGSPFEEGARLEWIALDAALSACARGEISDCKTELGLRRLADYLTAK